MNNSNPTSPQRRTSRWRNGLLGLAAALFMAPSANAQVTNYSFATGSDPYAALVAPTTFSINGGGGSADDGYSALQPIGFSFNFGGTAFTQFSMQSNGWLRLGATASTSSYTPMSVAAMTNLVVFNARDLNNTGAVYSYLLTGSPGSYICKIQANNYFRYGTAGMTGNAQIWLYEATGVIEIRYGAYSATWSTGTAQVGIRTTNTDVRKVVSATWAAVTSGSTDGVGNTAGITQATTNQVVSGTLYTFTPPLPCTGTPTPGNTTGPVAVGSGETVNLGLQNTTPGSGVTYQWRVSTTSAVAGFSNVGTSAPTYSPTQTAQSWYYCNVACGGDSTHSNVLQVDMTYCTPAPTSVDGTGITRVVYSTVDNPTGSEPSRYGDYSAMIGNVTQGTTVPVDITFTTGYTYDTKIWIDWNDDKDFLDAGEDVYTGQSLSANPTTLNASFAVGMNPLGNHRMRIGAGDNPVTQCYTGSYASFEDYTVNVVANAACAGTPTPGATTGPSAICVGDPVNLGLTNATLGSGVTYQWFESTNSGTGPWNPVGTGLDTYSPIGQTLQTWYYCEVTCSSIMTPSGVLQVSINPPSACYCTPGNFTYDIEPITLVNFAGINQTSCDAVDCDGDVVDYTAGTPGAVIAGQNYTITVKGNSNGNYANYYTAFFDWDQNGTFEDVQPIGSITNSTGLDALQASTSIAVPLSALAGSTRMRVIKNYNTSPTNPCGTYDFGQVEDYTINVSVPACTAPAVTINVVPNCPAGFEVDVAVADYGDGASATINWSLNGVPQAPFAAVLGTNLLPGGPFAGGADVDVTVLHENDSDCNVDYNNNTYACPPSNDDCGAPTPLTVNPDYNCGSVTAGTLALATASPDANACYGTTSDDVWFSFVATNSTHQVSLLNVAPYTDMYHAVYSGSCGALTNLSCSDGDVSTVTGLTVGVTYLVRVYSYYATPVTTTFNVCIGTPPAPPANDECANAVGLTVNPDYSCGTVTHGTVAGATASAEANTCYGTDDDDVWYTFTATSTAHRVSLINITGSTTDMYMAISSGSCGSLTSVLCSDNETANLTGLSIGALYTVRVYTYTGTAGQTSSFDICVGTTPPPPPNDLCANAIMVGANSVTPGYTSIGTNTGAPTGTCGTTLTSAPGVWYTVQGVNGVMTADLCTATSFDTKIGIFTGTCGAFTCVGGNDDFCGVQSSVTWTGLIGTTYYIYVTAYSTNNGAFNLTLSSVPGTSVVVAIQTDASPSEITWEITDASNAVVATGGPSVISGLDQRTVMVSATPTSGCYGFTLTDSYGDGIIGGNWQLRSTSGRVLLGDDFAGGSRSPSAVPAIPSYTQHSFCLPPGNCHTAAMSCGRFDYKMNNLVYCNNVPGATSYQFEFSNPDAGFIRRIAVPVNSVRFNMMVTSPLTPGVKYFTRVRSNATGAIADAHFGGGCELGLASTLPCTELISAPNYGHSCNEERAFNTNNSFIYATPVVGATEYQFRITIPSEGYDETFIRSTYILQLKWNTSVAPPMVNGSQYNVQVNVKVGTQYSGFCGDVCSITINNSVQRPEASMSRTAFGEATLWPNPVRESQVNLSINGIQDMDQHITVDVQDIYGKKIFAKEFGNSGERFTTILDLPGDIASGIYMVNITVNGKTTVQRLSIIR